MRRILTALVLALVAGAAFAACPPGTKYECRQSYNGKQICGCYYY
jgi:hypothetical protein